MQIQDFLTDDEINILIKEHQENKKDNSAIILNNYKHLIKKHVSYFKQNPNFEIDDLTQEANIALIKAINNYDQNQDSKFISYASSYIKFSLSNYANSQNVLYTPRNFKSLLNKYKQTMNELYTKLEHKPSQEEILRLTNYTLKEIQLFNCQITVSKSIYSSITHDSDTPLVENIVDNEITIEDIYENADSISCISKLINTMLESTLLTKREQEILILRYGLHNNKQHTLEEIAKIMNLTHQRIRSILIKIHLKIQKSKYIEELTFLSGYKLKKD